MSHPFWKSIRQDIIDHYASGQPEDWNESGIRNFLADLEDRIIERCKADVTLAEKCGVPFIKGRYAVEQLKTITPSTFKRIFKYQTITKSKSVTQNQFAIYFGYRSSEDYINKKKIKTTTERVQKTVKVKLNSKVLLSGVLALLFLFLVIPRFFTSSKSVEASPSPSINANGNTFHTEGGNSPVIIGEEVKVHFDNQLVTETPSQDSSAIQK